MSSPRAGVSGNGYGPESKPSASVPNTTEMPTRNDIKYPGFRDRQKDVDQISFMCEEGQARQQRISGQIVPRLRQLF